MHGDRADDGAEDGAEDGAAAWYDALPDGIVVADADQRIVLANDRACRLLGDDRLVGRTLADGLTLLDQDGVDWMTANTPYRGLSSRSGVPEQSWVCPDGTEVLVTARMTRARGGPVQRLALVLRSGRGRARLDRDRSDLVATVAHELRSPLTGVKGFVTTLLNKWDRLSDEQRKLLLTTVNTDADRLSRLITELLDVARIDTGRLPLYRSEVDTTALLTRIVDSARAATTRTVRLEAAGAPPIWADPDKASQVFTNLVENAVRHGEGTVTVTAEPGPLGTRVAVDDEGEGIPESIRTRVFTKFWQHGIKGGSGLGMYIVNGLVRAQGGTVTITDRPGGGARVVVDWPSTDQG